MNKDVQFKSENVLMSVVGHLFLIAIMLLSFSVVVERAKLVTPNRIQIVEIDLKDVKISGTETKLQNTTVPDVKPEEKNEKIKEKEPVKENTEQEKTELKQPTIIEDESKKTKNKDVKLKEKADDKPLPKKKKTVRVNREVLTLDRTMTISVVDALRVALTRCWNIDRNRPGLEDIRLTAHLKMLPTGVVDRIWFESESRAQTDPDFAYVLDTARTAIRTCSPFSMLPRNEYNTWRDIDVTFYPSQGKVM